jgi:hypothetical protein
MCINKVRVDDVIAAVKRGLDQTTPAHHPKPRNTESVPRTRDPSLRSG